MLLNKSILSANDIQEDSHFFPEECTHGVGNRKPIVATDSRRNLEY